MTLPKITIITVTLNASLLLKQTIESIINQTYSNIEYIIIDGKSKDNTIDIINKYEKYITYWCSENDNGIYDAMNKGILKSSGEWINFMNAGDSFVSNKTIENIFTQDQSYYDILCGNYILNSHNKSSIIFPKKNWKITNGMPSCHQTMFIKSFLHKQFNFDTTYKICADYDFIYKLHLRGYHKIHFLDMIIANFLDNGISSNKFNLSMEYLDIFKKYNTSEELISENYGFRTLYRNTNSNYLFSESLNLVFKQLMDIKNKYNRIILYGYGLLGKIVHNYLEEKICIILDQNQEVLSNLSVKTIQINEIQNHDFEIIIIAVLGQEEIITNTLISHQINPDKIISFKT